MAFLDRTARGCHRLVTGTWYMIAADGDLDIDAEIEMLLASLKGLTGREPETASSKGVTAVRPG